MINTFVSSSVLILMVLVIRLIFRKRINPLLQYGLWGIVALRLVSVSFLSIFSMGTSFSVMNVAKSGTNLIHNASNVNHVLDGTAQASLLDNTVFIMDNVRTGVVVSGDGISKAAAIDWQLVLMIVWILGTIFFGAWLIYVNHRFGKTLRKGSSYLRSVFLNGGKELSIYVVEGLSSPCLFHIFSETAIFVPEKVAENEKQLQSAIAHEVSHYYHHDLLWSTLRCGLLAMYWIHPLVWVAAILSKRDCELACDYSVIKEMNKAERLAYGKLLVDFIQHSEKKTDIFQLATSMNSNTKGMKERITMIANNRKMKMTSLIIVITIAVISIGCTFTDAVDGSNLNETEFANQWADAYSQRDANTIHTLCDSMEVYLTIGDVAENGAYWLGMSSPWPWNGDYVIDIIDQNTIDIYYYFRTSNPSVYVAKETITIKKNQGAYKVTDDSWQHYDQIQSKADFEQAYRYGFPDFSAFASAYQIQADGGFGEGKERGEILRNPQSAALEQLNLANAKLTGIYTDPYAKKAVVKFAWEDGEVTINLIQPILLDENGNEQQGNIWIVVNESM